MIDTQQPLLQPKIHHKPSRVPLHELQMLTQSVTSREYVHAYATPSISVRIKTLSIMIPLCLRIIYLSQALISRRAHVYIRVYTRR